MREETIKKHWKQIKDILDLSQEIKQLYDTRHAISFYAVKMKRQREKSPVENAIFKIDEKHSELKQKIQSYYAESAEIETWLRGSVHDPIMKAIIRQRFLTGKSWAEVAITIYGKGTTADIARIYYSQHKAEIYES